MTGFKFSALPSIAAVGSAIAIALAVSLPDSAQALSTSGSASLQSVSSMTFDPQPDPPGRRGR